jgi:O-antigen/teichoic acid export membrane protein
MRFVSAKRLLKTTSLLMAARIIGTGLGFLTQLALVRLMTTADYGVYVVAMSLAAVLSIFCAFGFPSIAARFVSQYQGQDDTSSIAGFIGAAQRHALVLSIFAVGFGGCFIFGTDLVSEAYQVPLYLACLTAPVLAMTRFNGALSNIASRFYLTYLPDLTLRPLLLVLGLAVAVMVAPAITSTLVLLAHFAAALVACMVLWVALSPRRHFGVRGAVPTTKNNVWRRSAFPMLFVTLLTSFLADIDILMMGLLLPPEDVSLFSVCLRIMLLVEFGIQTVFQMSAPDLSVAQAKGDTHGMAQALRRAQYVTLLFTIASFAGVFLLGEWILMLFGDGFVTGYSVLLILVLGQIVRASFGPITQVLTAAGEQMRSLYSYGAAFVVLVIGNILFVPTFGVMGGASVLIVTLTIGSALQARAVFEKLGISVLRTLASRQLDASSFAKSPRSA